MAELSKKQLEVLRSFYRDCVNKGIDPKRVKPTSSVQRFWPTITAQVKKILESAGIDASEAYRIGLESTEAKAKAEKEAAENAEKTEKEAGGWKQGLHRAGAFKCIGRG